MPTLSYFAYGSNMSSAEMLAYCPGAVCLGKARLDDWRLVFTLYSERRLGGVSDIVKLGSPHDLAALDPKGLNRTSSNTAPLSPVWGVLWAVDSRKLTALHAKEGYSPDRPREENVYDFIHCEVLLATTITRRVKAVAYAVVEKEDRHRVPNAGYLRLLQTGAQEHGISREYREALADLHTV